MRLWYRFSFIYLYTLLIYLVVEIDSRVVVDDDGLSTYFKIYTKEDTNSRINDTSKYDIQEDDYLLGYRFNNDIKCVEVDYKDSMLWKHNETMNMFPYKLLMNFYSKMMLIDYVNKWSYYYKPKTILISSNTINDDLISFYDLTLVTSDGNQFSENDTTQYEVITIGNIVGYRFNRGVRCVELRLKDKVLWKHNSNECGHNYPYCLYVNLLSKMIMVDLSDEWSYYSKYFNSDLNKHVNFDKQCDLFGYLSKTDLKIITSNYDSTLQENEQSHYILKQYKYVYEYRFKDGVKCIELKYDGNPVWKYNNDECQGIYPKVIYVNLYTKMLMVDLNNDWSYFYKYKTQTTTPQSEDEEIVDKPDELDLEQTTETETYTPLNIYHEEKSTYSIPIEKVTQGKTDVGFKDYDFKDTQLIVLDVESLKTNDSYYYYGDDETKTGIYIAKEGYLFRQVTQYSSWHSLNKITIHSANNYYNYSNRVMILGTNSKEIHAIVYFLNGQNEHNEILYNYKSIFKKRQIMEKKEFLKKTDYPSKVKVVTYEESGPVVNDTTKYDVIFQKVYYTNKPDNSEFMAYEYIFNKGVKCIEFSVRDEPVWKFDNGLQVFPSTIYYHENIKIVILEFNLYSFHIYKYIANQWKLVHMNKQEALSLDIESKKSTIQFLYTKDQDHDLHTYTARKGYEFNVVKKGGNIVWDAKTSSENSQKVMYLKTQTSEEYIGIILMNNNFVLLYRSNKNDLWTDLTSERYSFSNLQILCLDDTGYGSKEIEPDRYSFKTLLFAYGYEFEKDDVKCVEVKYNGKSIWKIRNYREDEYPRGIYLNLRNNNFLVKDKNGRLEIISGEGELTPIELDLNSNNGNHQYDCFKTTAVFTFMARSGFVFNVVKKGKEIAWKANNPSEYATKAVLEFRIAEFYDVINLKVYLSDKSVRIYNMSRNYNSPCKDKWIEETSDIPVEEQPSYVRIVTNDGSGLEFNDSTKYKVDKHHIGDKVYQFNYRFDENLEFMEIKFKHDTIWKTGMENFQSIDKLKVFIDEKLIHLYKNGIHVCGYDFGKGVRLE